MPLRKYYALIDIGIIFLTIFLISILTSSHQVMPVRLFSTCLSTFNIATFSIRTHLSLSRTISSLGLPSMPMKVGQTLVGANGCYRLTKHLDEGVHSSTVFKAEVLPGSLATIPSQWSVILCCHITVFESNSPTRVLIKTASPDNEDARRSLKREYLAYCRPSIASSSNFRAFYDIVGSPESFDTDVNDSLPCLVLEWLDCTLKDVPSKRHRQNYILLVAIVKAVLASLVTLHREGLVNTGDHLHMHVESRLTRLDLKPDNILLSSVDTSHPIVKIGDLGLSKQASLIPTGYRFDTSQLIRKVSAGLLNLLRCALLKYIKASVAFTALLSGHLPRLCYAGLSLAS